MNPARLCGDPTPRRPTAHATPWPLRLISRQPASHGRLRCRTAGLQTTRGRAGAGLAPPELSLSVPPHDPVLTLPGRSPYNRHSPPLATAVTLLALSTVPLPARADVVPSPSTSPRLCPSPPLPHRLCHGVPQPMPPRPFPPSRDALSSRDSSGFSGEQHQKPSPGTRADLGVSEIPSSSNRFISLLPQKLHFISSSDVQLKSAGPPPSSNTLGNSVSSELCMS